VSSQESCDVVIVGGGGSGLAAAIEARASGATVTLIEKNAKLGGSTAWSVGSVTATGTPHQRRKGIVDIPEDHWRDMAEFNGGLDSRDNAALRRVLADEMPGTFEWLLSHGIRFYGPMPEPPHRKPRMHNVLPNSRSFITHLEHAARRTGVVIRTNTRATRLISELGSITGVDCDSTNGTISYRAPATVLAAGDFASDPELKAQYMGGRQAKVDGVNITATGDGQKLAVALGARIINGDLALGPELRFVPPQRPNILLKLPPWRALAHLMSWSLDHMPRALLRPFIMSFVTTALAPSPALFEAGAVLVNKEGRRFTDELSAPAYDVPEQPDKIAYILLDAVISSHFTNWPNFISTAPGVAYAYLDDYQRNRRDVFTQADTLKGLASVLGLPAVALTETIRNHNATLGNRPRFGAGPYVALGPVRAVFVHVEGGLAVDADHCVLGPGDKPIPGLFAAGSTGQGGLLLKGHGHHLAWAFASGRRAGRNAARRAIAAVHH
jgi:fumarate reductase flavoprotein subunit